MAEAAENVYPTPPPSPADVLDTPAAQVSRSLAYPSYVLIIDLEGFQLRKDFYLKELAFYNPNTMTCWTDLFNPPFDRQFVKKMYATDMDWATRHLYGLTWEEGQYPYSLSATMISHFGSTHQLYAKGHEKCLWVQQYMTYPMIDLEKYGCPASKEQPFGCFCTFHNTLERS